MVCFVKVHRVLQVLLTLFGDGDKDRWSAIPDVDIKDAPKNSERDDKTKEYEDSLNFFRLPAGEILKSCREPHAKDVLGVRYGNEMISPSSPPDENPERELITVSRHELYEVV